MSKRILVSLGGNALGTDFDGMVQTVGVTAKSLVYLIEQGYDLVICHGNGPQVGLIKSFLDVGTKAGNAEAYPMSECVAMSQSYIGYHLQNAIQNALKKEGIEKSVTTMVTRVLVDPEDPRFQNPTKPIGAFMSKEEADALAATGKKVVEDAGRGYREVVASPKPVDIVEKEAINALLDSGHIVIAGGGGGIPVTRDGEWYRAKDAVIDKDWTSVKLAAATGCDHLVILTAVEKVAVHFNKPDQKNLDQMTLEEAQKYIDDGEFPAGSMLPKVEAAMAFASSQPGRKTLITALDKLEEGLRGNTGTWVVND